MAEVPNFFVEKSDTVPDFFVGSSEKKENPRGFVEGLKDSTTRAFTSLSGIDDFNESGFKGLLQFAAKGGPAGKAAHGILQGHIDQAKKAKEAASRGSYVEAAGRAGMAAIPIFGPMAGQFVDTAVGTTPQDSRGNVNPDAAEGDLPRALGQLAPIVAGAGAAKFVKAYPNALPAARAAGGDVAAGLKATPRGLWDGITQPVPTGAVGVDIGLEGLGHAAGLPPGAVTGSLAVARGVPSAARAFLDAFAKNKAKRAPQPPPIPAQPPALPVEAVAVQPEVVIPPPSIRTGKPDTTGWHPVGQAPPIKVFTKSEIQQMPPKQAYATTLAQEAMDPAEVQAALERRIADAEFKANVQSQGEGLIEQGRSGPVAPPVEQVPTSAPVVEPPSIPKQPKPTEPIVTPQPEAPVAAEAHPAGGPNNWGKEIDDYYRSIGKPTTAELMEIIKAKKANRAAEAPPSAVPVPEPAPAVVAEPVVKANPNNPADIPEAWRGNGELPAEQVQKARQQELKGKLAKSDNQDPRAKALLEYLDKNNYDLEKVAKIKPGSPEWEHFAREAGLADLKKIHTKVELKKLDVSPDTIDKMFLLDAERRTPPKGMFNPHPGMPKPWNKMDLTEEGLTPIEPGVINEASGIESTKAGTNESPSVPKQAPSVPGIVGQETAIRVPGSPQKYPARYEVAELGDVQSSHNGQTFQPNPKYGLKNDRNYDNSQNQAKIVQWSTKAEFDPAYHVTDAPDALNGPIVVDYAGNALGGNGRRMILDRVYKSGGGKTYRDMLEAKAQQFGINPESFKNMKEPVLVRRIDEQAIIDAGGSGRAITDFNVNGTADLTPAERVIADSRRVSASTFDDVARRLSSHGEDATLAKVLEGNSGREVLKKLIDDGVVSTQEQASLVDQSGLTKAGKDRISGLMMGRFFSDPAQINSIPASLRSKIEHISAPLVKAESHSGWSITPDVSDAIELIENARAHGSKNLSDFVKQEGLFGDQKYPAKTVQLAETMSNLTQKQLVDAVRQYAQDAEMASQGPGLFGDPPTASQSFKDAFAKPKPTTTATAADTLLDAKKAAAKRASNKSRKQ